MKKNKTPGGNLSDDRISQEEYEDTLIRMAFMELAEREAMEGDPDGDELPEGIDFKAAEKRHLRLMRRELRRMNFGPRLKRGLRITGKAAVYALAVMFVVTASTLAISREARKGLYKYLISLDEKYTQFVIRDSSGMNIPEGWNGEYFPTYIPEGFEVCNVFSNYSMNYVEYTNADGKLFSFDETSSDVIMQLDTEDAELKQNTIAGIPMFQVIKNGMVSFTWIYEDKYFMVNFDGSLKETEKIVASIIKIN
jgi:hypothetical protein